MKKQKLDDWKKCANNLEVDKSGSFSTFTFGDKSIRGYKGALPLALRFDDHHLSTYLNNGYVMPWKYCTMVDIPDDLNLKYGVGTYLCFAELNIDTTVNVGTDVFWKFKNCKTKDDVFKFAKEFGPLGTPLYAFLFSEHTDFLDQIDRSLKDGLFNQAEIKNLVAYVKKQPYYEDWQNGKLLQMAGESVTDWLESAKEVRCVVELKKLIEDNQFDELNRRLPVAASYDIASETLTIDPGEDSTIPHRIVFLWGAMEAGLKKHKFKGPKASELYNLLLLEVVNSHLKDSVSVVYELKGKRLRYSSLLPHIWAEVGDFLINYPELQCCANCGEWFPVRGKARGRGKKTCSTSCRVRLSQKNKKSEK